MARLAQLDVSGRGQHRLHRVHEVGQPGPRLQQVELLGHRHAHAEVATAAAEAIGERQQDAEDLLGFFFLQRHDVVVRLDRGHRLDEEARAGRRRAVHDAGNRRLVLGPHHQHEAAVPAGDHLLLQVLGGVTASGELIERGAQLRPLAAQPLTNRRQRRTGVVDDLAVHVDGAAHGRDLVGERRQPGHQPLQDGEAARGAADRRLRLGDRGDEVGEDAQLQRLERTALHRQAVERRSQAGAGPQREDAVLLDVADRLAGCRQCLGDDRAVGLRLLGEHPGLAHRGEREARQRVDDAVELEGRGIHDSG